jgi:hypothetical protein
MGNQYAFSADTDLAPLMSEDGINYRVPVQIETETDNTFVVHVGNKHVRVFTPEKLPDFIRVRLSMIKASGGGEMLNIKSDAHLSILDMFRTRQGNLEGIGWQASDTMFIVIMSSKELSTVKDIR